MLDLHSGVSEVLWVFNCLASFENKNNHLPLEKNPYFYRALPTSPDAFGGEFRMEPIQNFQNEMTSVQVLIDNLDNGGWVFLEIAGHTRIFCNVWITNDTIIFQGFMPFMLSFSLSDTFSDVRGNLVGERIVGAAIQRLPNLWCFMERPLPPATQQALSPNLDPMPFIEDIIQITSASLKPNSDWREPIRRMSKSRDINVRLTDNPHTPDFPLANGSRSGLGN